jgi:hypothetical protein
MTHSIIDTLLSIEPNLNNIDYRHKKIKRVLKEFNLNTQDVKKMITIYIQNNKDTKYIQHIRNDIPKIDDVNDNLLKSFRYNQLLSFIQINQLHFIQKIKIKYYYNIF